MTLADQTLLPEGVETTFAEIESTMARVASGERPCVAAGRSLAATATATVVAVGPRSRLVEAAGALKAQAEAGSIRAILIASGHRSTPAVRVTSSEIALEGLRTEFINNAVAALRLPSLPALVWWRGGEPQQTEDLARLADRLVLDAEEPEPLWIRMDSLVKEALVSDLRWTALTRWRALMAHFFDMPGVPAAVARFTRLQIAGSDASSARLFAGWLGASLKWQKVQVDFTRRPGAAIDTVIFGNGRDELSLRRLPGSTCVEARARLAERDVLRTASLGDQSLAALVAEELRVRSHDVAFEAAVRAAGAVA